VVLTGCWAYQNNSVAFDIQGPNTDAQLIGCVEMDPAAGATVSVQTGTSTRVTLIHPYYITPLRLDPSTMMLFDRTITGDVTVAGTKITVDSPNAASVVIDRAGTGNLGQVEFRTAGATTNGWALTHLNGTSDLRVWNFRTSRNALVLDSAGTYIDMVSKRVINVSDPTAVTDAVNKQYVDSLIWTGTQAEYDAIAAKNPGTLYVIV
jgi:hypothetical protein